MENKEETSSSTHLSTSDSLKQAEDAQAQLASDTAHTLDLESTDSVSTKAQVDSIGEQEVPGFFENIIRLKKKKKKSKKPRSKRGLVCL